MRKLLLTSISAAVIALSLNACDSDDGPMEEAGEKLDESYRDAVSSLQEATDNAEEVAEETGDRIEETTDKMH